MRNFVGAVVTHQKAKAAGIEITLKAKVTYCSVNLGIWPRDEPPSIAEAKKCLMSLGWFSDDDIERVLGEKETANLLEKIVAAYDVKEKA